MQQSITEEQKRNERSKVLVDKVITRKVSLLNHLTRFLSLPHWKLSPITIKRQASTKVIISLFPTTATITSPKHPLINPHASSRRSHFPSLSRLFSELRVEFLLNPLLVVRRVRSGGFLEDEAGEIGQLVDEVEQLRYVVRDGRTVGVHAFEMLLEDLADTLYAFGDGFEV